MTDVVFEQQNADERVKDIFRRLMELYERHAQERQLIVKEKEEINRLVQLLVSQTKEFGQYENGIRKRIQDCIKEAANISINSIEQLVIEKSNQSVEQAVNKIGHISQSVEGIIAAHRSEKNKLSWKIFAAGMLSGILSSLLMTWVLMPKPTLPLNTEQLNYLQQGEMLVKMWPKLTKHEKDRLKSVSYEVVHSINVG